MLSPKDIRRQLEISVAHHLRAKNFTLLKGCFVRERTPEVHDWIALPHAVRDKNGPVHLTASIGIRVPRLHRLLQQIGAEPSGHLTALFSVNIGYLTPERRWTEWPFARTKFSADRAEELMDYIVRFGLPFQEQFTGLEQVYTGLQEHGIRDYNRSRLPALAFLMGRRAEAIRSARESLQEYAGVEHAYAQHLRQSLENLIELAHENPA